MTKELETEARNRSTNHRWVDTLLDSTAPYSLLWVRIQNRIRILPDPDSHGADFDPLILWIRIQIPVGTGYGFTRM